MVSCSAGQTHIASQPNARCHQADHARPECTEGAHSGIGLSQAVQTEHNGSGPSLRNIFVAKEQGQHSRNWTSPLECNKLFTHIGVVVMTDCAGTQCDSTPQVSACNVSLQQLRQSSDRFFRVLPLVAQDECEISAFTSTSAGHLGT